MSGIISIHFRLTVSFLQDETECFDCIPKPTPKTFPVCTIRSTPSQPIHCIVWSKSYLLGYAFFSEHHCLDFRQHHGRQLFGEDEDAGGELDQAEEQGENGIIQQSLFFHLPPC